MNRRIITSKLAAHILVMGCLAMPCTPVFAGEQSEVPADAVENYLSEDMKRVPDGTYIPYPEDVEEFRNSPLYKFLKRLGPKTQSPVPSSGGCPVNKEFLENV
ncbi:MAG: hypothetical protein KDI90_11985 [Alphaproteobacteria bacterium]|nr:hypothetical protein [Alphaproteobacteria bacterium]MCB9975593.1 hypothetical protein [Rhodospirillales bacterium]